MNKMRYAALAVLTAAVFFFGCKNNVRTQDLSGKDNGTNTSENGRQNNLRQSENGTHANAGDQNSGNGKNQAQSGQKAGQTAPDAYTYKITNITYTENSFAREYMLKIEPENVLKDIDMLTFNAIDGQKETSKHQVFYGGRRFFVDTNQSKIYIWEPQNGTTIGFKDKSSNILGVFKYEKNSKTFKKIDVPQALNPQEHRTTLNVRLKGTFEAAIVGQKKYDGMAGASGSLSLHKNSNVKVQISEKENPEKDSDWTDIETSGLSFKKSTVKIEPACSMSGFFSTRFGSLTLSGVPDAAGNFEISVELRCDDGRTAVSNALPFNVYDLNKTTLEERLKDIKDKAWDQEPWNIVKFGGSSEKITVPQTLERWFGSHTSGTYGELGYAVANGAETTQTLVVDSGSNLKLINMKVLSSVNIVVKKGGKLNLQDSSIHGTITVEEGGFFQMNYDHHKNQFATGAQINGQLRLKNGATLGDSLIYSNTNYLANGNVARRNKEPVVTVEGTVTIAGKVYVRGDEAPTGPYSGQHAMSITNGSVIIKAGAELGLYGGGRYPLTTNGGEALILNSGKVEGEGRLIAIGGNGSSLGSGNGGNAVSGTGTLDIKEVFLQGGNTYSDRVMTGKPYTETVTVTDKPIGQASNGKRLYGVNDYDNLAYWNDILKPPVYNYETANKPKIKH